LDKYPFSDYRIKLPEKKVEFLYIDGINKLDGTDFKVTRLNIIIFQQPFFFEATGRILLYT